MVNISKEDAFAFSEMLRTTKHVEGRDCRKSFVTANEIDSAVSQKIKRLGNSTVSPGTSANFSLLQPKQLSSTLPVADVQPHFFP